MHPLVGKKYVFDDGNVIEIIQIKDREVDSTNTQVVTYHTYGPRSLPKKTLMPLPEFLSTFAHLFGNQNE